VNITAASTIRIMPPCIERPCPAKALIQERNHVGVVTVETQFEGGPAVAAGRHVSGKQHHERAQHAVYACIARYCSRVSFRENQRPANVNATMMSGMV
jgi:hypothetical protein